MNAHTPITISFPDSDTADYETTWASVAEDNADCPETIADIAAQIAEHGYAEIGGGAASRVWIFAGDAEAA